MIPQDLLQSIEENFHPLSSACKEEMLSMAKLHQQKKHSVLVREGQYSHQTFYLISGCARAYYLHDGKEVTDWIAFEGEFISAIVSFFSDRPSPHYIELLEDSILVEFQRDQVEALADRYHEFERLLRKIVTQTMLKQQEKIASIQFHSAEERYKKLLDIRPDITKRVPLTHIASYLGITLETLSRIRRPHR